MFMQNITRKNEHNGKRRTALFAILLLLPAFIASAQQNVEGKYLFAFTSTKSTCLLRVNDLPAFDNTTDDDDTLSAGLNMTAFLENGSNQIELLMGPQDAEDPQTLFADSSCQVTITYETEKESVRLADYRLAVNDKKAITALYSVDATRGEKFTEGYSKLERDYGLYKMQGALSLQHVPVWSWVNATPVTENDLPKIRKAYEDIWAQIKRRDIDGLKRTAKVSSAEMARAEATTPEMIFVSNDLPAYVAAPELTPVEIDWEKYHLLRYRDGRLFRLGVGFFQNSPLMFQDAKGKVIYTWNPLFSMIDGKVVLVR